MKILKKENAWIWLILLLLTSGASTFILGALLDVYDKKAWYYRWTKKIPKWLFKTLIVLFVVIYIAIMVLSLLISFGLFKGITLNNNLMTILSFLVLAVFVLYTVFTLQILCQTAALLNVQGKEIYLSPYIWILCIIIPVIGWVILIAMTLYLEIFNIVMLYKGSAEKYIKE